MKKMVGRFGRRHRATLVAVGMAASTASVHAVEVRLGEEAQVKLNGAFTFGAGYRTEDPRPEAYGSLAGNRVGRPGGLAAANAGGPNLNFDRGSTYSRVLKGFLDLDIHEATVGVFARAKAWHDFELDRGDRPYGNHPNRFAQGVPLSDSGFAREAAFNGAHVTAAFVYGKFDVAADSRLDARLGRQFVNWGTSQSFTGGINVVNPRDFAAAVRPGALPEETGIPVGMLYANLAAGKQWGLDGFVPYEWRHHVLGGCGTFFNVATYAPEGCNQANVLSTVNEPTALATGLYVHRAPDVEAKDSGEFGMSLRYAAAALGTEFRAYGMNYHSRSFSIRGTNPGPGVSLLPTAAGVAARLTAPNGLRYALIYPEDIRLFGLSFDTRAGVASRIFGEIAYRPNQPLSLNFADLADAFVARNPFSILNLPPSGKNALALPPAATFDAYDRFKVTTASLGLNQGLPGVLGSQRVIFGAEIGWSHVAGLPDPGTIRYGRSEAYGVAAVPGAPIPCIDSYPGKTCAHEGFITRNAWGYRARIASTYNDTFLAGAALTASLFIAHDVKGYSYDGTFLEDRMLYGPGLRADWARTYFAEILWTRYSNRPRYSMLIDRDNLTLVAGVKF
jgi:hypothetical protein